MKHIVYKTTNIVNGKYYIGKHSCNCSPNCNYLGSGKIIYWAIEKYGKGNFRRETLASFKTSKEAYEYEREIITQEMLNSNNCYNIIKGGLGVNSDRAKEITIKKPCAIKDKIYNSITEAAKDLNKNPSQIKRYIETGSFPISNVKEVIIDGIKFKNNKEAGNYFNTTRFTISRWIKRQGSRNIKSEKINLTKKAVKCVIDNIEFNSYIEAGKYFDVSPNIIQRWIDKNNSKSKDKKDRINKGNKCVIEGVEYRSAFHASKILKRPPSQIKCYIKNGYFKKERGKPIVIEGIIYKSIKTASEDLKMSSLTIRKRLQDGIYKFHPNPIII